MEDHSPFISKAKKLVKDYYNAYVYKPYDENLTVVGDKDVYIVWFVKVLQNWKALVATTNADGLYFEVTYDGDKDQTYIDHYTKTMNLTISDEQFSGYLYPTPVPAK